MKHLIFTILIIVFPTIRGNSQVNNLKDLLEISELNAKEMVNELQYTWKLQPPIQDTSEKGFVTERYTFTFDRDNKKQVLKKCGKMDLDTGQKFWLTNFISDDKDLLNRITKNLIYQGFALKGKPTTNSMYEDGNRIVTIQTKSDNDYPLPKNCYSINVIINKKTNSSYLSGSNERKIIVPEKTNPLDNISNSKSNTTKKISLLTKLSDLLQISKTSSDKVSTVLNSDWKFVEYPKNLEPVDEWYSYKNSDQLIESYMGWDNGIGKDLRITSFEFSQKKLLDEILLELNNSDFKLVEKTKDYYNFENNNNIIGIYLNRKIEEKEVYKIEISTAIISNFKGVAKKKI
ncbi:hypothetical protein [Flavobacterium daemonense]|uniref:hypothetical protein n=1 Tax=Flavobacterium daemonense TaxID=1393049 RepID=UPI0011850B52|nr:hypothetical protein [Flavobacterium daemonense]KAF2336151.1 hypothetical protein FND99_02390 [Flavobacterium daemonense]